MTGDTRLVASPPGVRLCPLADLAEGGARNFVLQMRSGRFHGFVVRRGAAVNGYLDRCPHAGVPLAREPDRYLTPDGALIACGWHGALFSIDDGRCVGGPCVGRSLTPWPVTLDRGWVETA